VIAAILIGVVAGVLAGMLGIGGGALFVPALVIVLGHGQIDAEATSLAAMVPVALLGAWRQRSYGNVRLHDALLLGTLAVPGAVVGVWLSNVLPVVVVRDLFAVLLLYTAYQLVRRSWRAPAADAPGDGPPAR
jgi:uncharacterized membrane protein YfcA